MHDASGPGAQSPGLPDGLATPDSARSRSSGGESDGSVSQQQSPDGFSMERRRAPVPRTISSGSPVSPVSPVSPGASPASPASPPGRPGSPLSSYPTSQLQNALHAHRAPPGVIDNGPPSPVSPASPVSPSSASPGSSTSPAGAQSSPGASPGQNEASPGASPTAAAAPGAAAEASLSGEGETRARRRTKRSEAQVQENEKQAAQAIKRAVERRRAKEFDPDRYPERPAAQTQAAQRPSSSSSAKAKKGRPKSAAALAREKEERAKQLEARKRRKASGQQTLGDILSDSEQQSDGDNPEDDDIRTANRKRPRAADKDDDDDDGEAGGGGLSGLDGLRQRMAANKRADDQRRSQIIPRYTGPDDMEDDAAANERHLATLAQMQTELQMLSADCAPDLGGPEPPEPGGSDDGAHIDSKHSIHAPGQASSGPGQGGDKTGGDGTTAKKKRVRARVVLTAAQESAKEKWKQTFWRKKQLEEAEKYGIRASQINLDQLSADQIAAVLLRPISDEASRAYLNQRLGQWLQIVRSVNSTVSEAFRRVDCLFYGLHTVPEFDDRHVALSAAAERLKELMGRNNMLDIREESGRANVQNLQAIQNNIDTVMICKYAALDMQRGTKTYVSTKIPKLASLRSSQQELQQELANAKDTWSVFAQLLDKILDRAQEWKLVRIEGQVYQPIMHGKHWTRAYKQWQNGEIMEFVHKAASLREKDPELYGMLYDRGTYWKQIVEILKYTYDDRFPEVTPSRFWYAFSNGIYNIADDAFYEYGSLGFNHLPDEVVCCTYFDQKFDNAEYEWHMAHGPHRQEPWYNIPTPHLDKICETQEWSREECKWWYAGGGRMLFPLGKFDNWGKMWMHLGRAGCGKTTYLKYIAGYFPRMKVGVVNNNCEKVFTIQHLEKTWSWFGFDIKENWSMDQTLWNTMVDGGLLPLARKYLGAKLTDFDQHGAIASNRLMNWPDLSGQLLRRLFPHIYRKSPENMGSPTLARDLESERAAALKKLACGYLFKAKKHQRDQLADHVLPKSIRDSLALIRREANPLMAFLESDKIVINKNYYTDRRKFVKEFTAYAVEIGIRGAKSLPSVNDAFFADVLEAKDLRMANDTRPWPFGTPWNDKTGIDITERKPRRTMWIVGCALKEFEDQQPAYQPDPSLATCQQQWAAANPHGAAPSGNTNNAVGANAPTAAAAQRPASAAAASAAASGRGASQRDRLLNGGGRLQTGKPPAISAQPPKRPPAIPPRSSLSNPVAAT